MGFIFYRYLSYMTRKQLKQLIKECLCEIDFAPGFRPQREFTVVASVSGSDTQDLITYLEELHQVLTNYFGDNITYVTNSFFSRSQNSTENVKILTIGCSQTFGLGIQYSKNIWPIILSKKMNLKCMNLAEPGDNIFGQIIKANKYIKNK